MGNNQFNQIAIVGLGYVGLPLCMRFCESGIKVIGLDVDLDKVNSINRGESYIKHIDSALLYELTSDNKLKASNNFEEISSCDAILICVPTPLGKNNDPDISYVIETGKSIAPYLNPEEQKKKKLVVLESTTFPGTTDEDLRKVLEDISGLKAGEDFNLAYSPEREDPGRVDHNVKSIPKVMGGYTTECLDKCVDLYSKAVDTICPVSSTKVAEASKLTENIFRSVNIALVNELKMVYEKMDINIWEVIEAASTKPFGYMPFHPGPGLGGHCIPIDPFYLSWKANQVGIKTKFIELAGEINCSMPEYVVGKVEKALSAENKSVDKSRILLLGLAYKPNVDDTRESPSFVLIDTLSSIGAVIDYYDPYIHKVPKIRKYPELSGKKAVNWDKKVLGSYDLVIISTAHDVVSYDELGQWASIIVDTRNVMSSVKNLKAKVYIA